MVVPTNIISQNEEKSTVSECVLDSTNRIVWITSAYINKNGSKGQLLNMEDKTSPQPTPKASFDGNATTNSISQNREKSTVSEKKFPTIFTIHGRRILTPPRKYSIIIKDRLIKRSKL